MDYACRHAPVQRGQKGHGGIPSSVIIFCPTIAATDESGEDGSESESSRNTAHKTAVLIKGFTGGYAEVHFQICEMSARGAAVSEELRGHQTLFDLCSVALSSRHVEVKLRHLQCTVLNGVRNRTMLFSSLGALVVSSLKRTLGRS